MCIERKSSFGLNALMYIDAMPRAYGNNQAFNTPAEHTSPPPCQYSQQYTTGAFHGAQCGGVGKSVSEAPSERTLPFPSVTSFFVSKYTHLLVH